MNSHRLQIWSVGLAATVTALCSGRRMQQHRVPAFPDFPVSKVYTGHPSGVDFANDPLAARFRTTLTEGARKGPNFAGQFTIVRWGCGTDCTQFAILDAKTGRVPYLGDAMDIDYRLESELLIIDSPDAWCRHFGTFLNDRRRISTYYRWTGAALVLLDSIVAPQCPDRR